MKYYCLDYEECGYSWKSENLLQEEVCPACSMPVLIYEDETDPIWDRAPDGALSKESNENRRTRIK